MGSAEIVVAAGGGLVEWRGVVVAFGIYAEAEDLLIVWKLDVARVGRRAPVDNVAGRNTVLWCALFKPGSGDGGDEGSGARQ